MNKSGNRIDNFRAFYALFLCHFSVIFEYALTQYFTHFLRRDTLQDI